MMKRERFFECACAHDRNEYRCHIRAWTPEEASEHLRLALREDGVRDVGTLLVRDRRAAVVVRSDYAFDSA